MSLTITDSMSRVICQMAVVFYGDDQAIQNRNPLPEARRSATLSGRDSEGCVQARRMGEAASGSVADPHAHARSGCQDRHEG